MNLLEIRSIAVVGIDIASTGELTKNATAADLSGRFVSEPARSLGAGDIKTTFDDRMRGRAATEQGSGYCALIVSSAGTGAPLSLRF